MIWFIVLNVLLSDGTLLTDVRFPKTPTHNNQESCNSAGQLLADQKQMEIGTNSGVVFYICKSITSDEIKAATGQKQGANL